MGQLCTNFRMSCRKCGQFVAIRFDWGMLLHNAMVCSTPSVHKNMDGNVELTYAAARSTVVLGRDEVRLVEVLLSTG